MISVNGSTFMTLGDPIYINGRRVREVWANGNLVYPCVPVGIKIIYPPYKFEYKADEIIDYTGIVVELLNPDGSTFKSLDYPDGEIPFEELIFPVTKADKGGYWYQGGIIRTDGGINAMVLSCDISARKDGRQTYYTEALWKWIDQYDCPAFFSTYSPSIVLATMYNNNLYVYGVSDIDYGTSTMWVWQKTQWWDYWGRTYYGKWSRITMSGDRNWSYIPVSSVDPTIAGFSIEYQFLDVPVRWKSRYDSKVFEDYTEIRFTRETPIPQNS